MNKIIERGGSKKYYSNNELHRLDGPAIERSDGIHDWYINGKHVCMSIDNSDGTQTFYVQNKSMNEQQFKKLILNDYLQATLDFKATTKKVKL